MFDDRSPPGADAGQRDGGAPIPQPAGAGAPGCGGSVLRYRAQPDPGGLRWGLGAACPLGLGRVAADRWDAIAQGSTRADWRWPSADAHAQVHRHGQTLFAAINISTAIPGDHGAKGITDPDTRRAAKAFLRAYVQWLLDNAGAAVLTIDEDIVAQQRLDQPGSEGRGIAWAQWYLDAVEVARSAAAERGKASRLKLQPCLGGDPLAPGNPLGPGGAARSWLRELVAASDGLALALPQPRAGDGPPTAARLAEQTIGTLRCWVDHCAGERPVVVAALPTFGAGGLAQDAYLRALLPRLLAARRDGGVLHRLLRGCFIDLGPQAAALAAVEADAGPRPFACDAIDGEDLAARLRKGRRPVPLRFSDGDDFEFLRYQDTGLCNLDRPTPPRLQLRLAAPGDVLLQVNGHWLVPPMQPGRQRLDLDISAHYAAEGPNTIDILATGPAFPVDQQVEMLSLVQP